MIEKREKSISEDEDTPGRIGSNDGDFVRNFHSMSAHGIIFKKAKGSKPAGLS